MNSINTNSEIRFIHAVDGRGAPSYVKLDRSHNDPNLLYMSAPHMTQMNLDQVMEFVTQLLEMSAVIWPDGKGDDADDD